MHIRWLLLLNILFELSVCSYGQTSASCKIITRDVVNFWEAVDSLKSKKDTTQIFQTLVIDRATKEFKVFIKKWNIKAENYKVQIKRYPDFYRTLRENTIRLINSHDSIITIVNRFHNMYPGFVAADICIGFGNFSTGGNIEITNAGNYVYIGLEYHGLDSSTITDELSPAIKDYVSRSNFFRTIIHELVHIQQNTHGQKVQKSTSGNLLMHRILREGIPDFIAQLVVKEGNNGNYFKYGIEHEEELQLKLKNELKSKGNGIWFGGADYIFINMPRDLGYFMGNRIANSYYNHYGNFAGLIDIKDPEKFIKQSKYFSNITD